MICIWLIIKSLNIMKTPPKEAKKFDYIFFSKSKQKEELSVIDNNYILLSMTQI